MRIAELSGHVKAEVLIVLEDLFAQLDLHRAACLYDAPIQNGSINLINSFPESLEQDSQSQSDGLLQFAGEEHNGGAWLQHNELLPIGLFLFFNPEIGLDLGIDHQRPPFALRHHDCIVDRKLIIRQLVRIYPYPDRYLIRQRPLQ